MEKQIFEKLKAIYGTHKKAAKALDVSYSRYNEWRWNPKCVPKAMSNYLELAVLSTPPAGGPEPDNGGHTSLS
jgi:hypothetical protein